MHEKRALLEEIIEPLLAKVREIGDMKEAPEGREGCEDCRRVGELVRLLCILLDKL